MHTAACSLGQNYSVNRRAGPQNDPAWGPQVYRAGPAVHQHSPSQEQPFSPSIPVCEERHYRAEHLSILYLTFVLPG